MLLLVVMLMPLTMIVEGTGINVNIPTHNYMVGDTVNATLICTPTTWIKAFEMKVLFSKSKLQCNQVIEGGFFKPKQTFFNYVINNTNGEIKDVYDLIVGQGNVTSTKPIFYVMFQAKAYGRAYINLSGVGITNETKYLTGLIVSNTTFYIYSPYDLNYDQTIGLPDILMVAGSYHQSGSPGWIHMDIDKNGIITLIDLILVAFHWGNY